MRKLTLIIPVVWLAHSLSATEYHVSVAGRDANEGSAARPFKTISAAALRAQPGDVITVHAGIYRERINPPRGGESDQKRIVYQAAPGETGRDQGVGGRHELGEGPGRCVEGDTRRTASSAVQPLQRSHSRGLVQRQEAGASYGRRLSQRRLADRGGPSWRMCSNPRATPRSGSARWIRRPPRFGRSSRA